MTASPTPESLGPLLRQLRRDLDRALDTLDGAPGLRDVEASRAFLERYLEDLDAQLERHSSAAVITLVGATGAGKSTLLNALAGAEIATPGTTRPTTTTPVLFRPPGVDVEPLVDELGGSTKIDVVDSAHTRFAEHVLIDAPDTNSHAREHHRTVALLAERSDVLIVVCHRQSVAEMMSVEFVDRFAGRRHLCFVLNRADELDAEATAEVLGQLREFVAERWGADGALVVATSARAAADGQPDAGFEELAAHLEELVAGGALGRIRRDNALGTCAALAGWARELRAALAQRADAVLETAGLDAFAALGAALDRQLGALLELLDAELAGRLELQQHDIALLLWNETARRWQGPGGLALRSGGLTGLGLGAGALAMRRSPWLAAGAAAGSILVDRAQSGLRERRVERGSGLIPSPHEIEGLYREALGAPRLLAQDLTGDPEALGLPRADEVAAAAHAGIEAVWARFLERDLPAAGKRCAGWGHKLLVDGPVYLVLAWLVLQALAGVLPSSWLEGLPRWAAVDALTTDRLINTAIVLVAWLFLARAVVRAELARHARVLTAEVARQASAELGGLQDALAKRAQRELDARAAALTELETLDASWEARLRGGR